MSTSQSNTTDQQSFHRVQVLVANDTFLKLSVLDLQVYDGTLVAFIDHELPGTFVKNIIQKSWPGPVEVYCATDLFADAQANL